MTCPSCRAHNTYIARTHPGDGESVKRSRCCAECGHTFETVEQLASVSEAQASALRVQAFRVLVHKIANGNGGERCT